MEVNLQGKDSVTVINAYTQTSSAEDEKVEQFYGDVERAMADSDSKYKIITGDFNAKKNGTKTKEDFKSMGAFGIGERNERRDRLIEFTEEHNLIIANTLFQKQKSKNKKQNKTKQNKTNKQTNKQTNNPPPKKKQQKTTPPPKKKKNPKNQNQPDTGLRSHPMGTKKTQIDLTLSSQRGTVTNCEVITKADIGSDHRLVRMTMRINKRLARLKTINKQKPFNIITQKLKGMKETFEINLKKYLKNLRRR